MLNLILVSFVVMLLAVAGMSVGLMRNRPIKGSCGGVANQDGYDCACAAAGKPKMCEQSNNQN